MRTCPECKARISRHARTCPSCGRPFRRRSSIWRILGAVIAFAVLAVAIVIAFLMLDA